MPYLNPGQIFAERYRVDRFIAEGGMGAVFAGAHVTTEMRVAIKVLRPSVLSTQGASRRFELEAKVAARVRSDHIVKVLDAGTDAETGLPYLIMELLEGHSMEQLVLRHGPLSPERAVRLLEQAAEGLDRAHNHMDADGSLKPIVHRDLKPENLFVTDPYSSRAVVKILDFGIAKVLSSTSAVSQDLRGTPLYMAYEQACGQAVTPQTDVWALGLIAFYLLTGRCYWRSSRENGSLASLVREITSDPIDAASSRISEWGIQADATLQVPRGFDEWLARCLRRRPEERFASAGEAIAMLGEALGVVPATRPVFSVPAPVEEAPPSTIPQTRTFGSPSMGHTNGELSVARTQVHRAEAPRAPSKLGAAAAAVGLLLALGGVAFWFFSQKLLTDTDGVTPGSTAPATQVSSETAPNWVPPMPTVVEDVPSVGGGAPAPSTSVASTSTAAPQATSTPDGDDKPGTPSHPGVSKPQAGHPKPGGKPTPHVSEQLQSALQQAGHAAASGAQGQIDPVPVLTGRPVNPKRPDIYGER